MIQLDRLLIVEDSAVMRHMLERAFRPYARAIQQERCVRKGLDALEQDPGFDLVLSDVMLPDGDGFEILEFTRGLEAPPPLILATARPVASAERRALEMGAVGYLGKPCTVRDVANALADRPVARRGPPRWGAPRVHAEVPARIIVCDGPDEREASVTWELRDLSEHGAFVLTDGPLELGTRLRVRLEIGGLELPATVEVVRVQEPAWGQPGGVGVAIEGLDADAADRLALHLATRPSLQGARLTRAPVVRRPAS